jgi:hypothetical protein
LSKTWAAQKKNINDMQTKPKLLTVLAVLLQVVFALTSIFLAYRHLNTPPEPGEFSAIKNASVQIGGLLAMLLNVLLLAFAFAVFRRKRWAYITSIILIVLSMLVLGAGTINALIFELSPGSPLSVTSEILPSLVLLLLILSFKDFRKKV